MTSESWRLARDLHHESATAHNLVLSLVHHCLGRYLKLIVTEKSEMDGLSVTTIALSGMLLYPFVVWMALFVMEPM